MTFPLAAGLVVPHSSRMLLIDTVLGTDENSLTAEARVRDDHPLARDGVVGSWVGVEYLAQAIAAFEGCRARARGVGPKVGFLIGSRHFSSNVPTIPVGATLSIHVARQWEEDGLGLFEGRITGDGFSAEGSISVFQPEDAQQFLRESNA